MARGAHNVKTLMRDLQALRDTGLSAIRVRLVRVGKHGSYVETYDVAGVDRDDIEQGTILLELTKVKD